MTITFGVTFGGIPPVAPIITSANTLNQIENVALSHTLTADKTVTWTKTGGSDTSLFTLIGATLSLPAQNYEAPSDSNADRVYQVIVMATDTDTLTASQTISVTITDAGEGTIPINAWQNMPSGGGGFVTGVKASDSGRLVCKTDVFDAYKMEPGGTFWTSLNNKTTWGVTNIPTGGGGQMGCYDITICATSPNYMYQINGARSPSAFPDYRVHYSSNGGATWTQSALSFTTASAQGDFGNDRMANEKVVADPNNPLHCVVGAPNGTTLNNGVWRCLDGNTFVRFNGTAPNGLLPSPHMGPGCAGIVFDRQFGTITLPGGGGATNYLLQSQNLVGTTWAFYQSSTVSNAAVAPDGTTTAESLLDNASITDTHTVYQNISTVPAGPVTYSFYAKANTLNWIQLSFWSDVTYWANFNVSTGAVGSKRSGVTSTIVAAANGYYRCSMTVTSPTTSSAAALYLLNADINAEYPIYPGSGTGSVYVWGGQLEVGTTTTTYIPTTTTAAGGGGSGGTVTKRFLVGIGGQGYYETWDGGQTFVQISSAVTPDSPNISITTTQANSVILIQLIAMEHGKVQDVINVSGPMTPTWMPRLEAGSYGSLNPYGNANFYSYYAVAASAGTYVFKVSYKPGTLAVGSNNVTNHGQAFAVKNVDVSSGGANIFACGAPSTNPGVAQGYAQSVTLTTIATGMIFGFSGSRSTAADGGYTLMSNSTSDGFWGFWSERSGVATAAAYPGLGAAAGAYALGFVFDALRQAGGTIAIDGTPVYFTSGPASQATPVNPTGADINYNGDMICINGPSANAAGGLWRYKRGTAAGNGTWGRIDGSAASGAMHLGWPGRAAYGSSPVYNSLSGQGGKLIVWGAGKSDHAWQTNNAEATAITDIVWLGSDDYSFLPAAQSSQDVPWLLETGNIGGAGACFDRSTGQFWLANGLGVIRYDLNPSFNVYAYSVAYKWFAAGIEESYVQQVLSPPGSDNVLICTEDANLMLTTHARYEAGLHATNHWPPYEDTHAWCIDYAPNNPSFVAFYSAGLHPGAPGYSFSSGNPGTWIKWAGRPHPEVAPNGAVGNIMPGQIAISSASQTTNVATFNANVRASTATSTTSVTLATGAQTFTVQTGMQGILAPGFPINIVSSTSGNSNNFMYGTITSYDNATGVLVTNITTANAQTPTDNSWIIRIGPYYGADYKVCNMSSVVGTPAAGDLLIGAGVPANTTIVQQGGAPRTNSWIVSDASADAPSMVPMSVTRQAAKAVVIQGNQGNNLTPQYTTDCFATFQNCVGLGAYNYNPGAKEGFALNIVSDKGGLADTLYCVQMGVGCFRSQDGGANWHPRYVGPLISASYPMLLYAIPGQPGHIILSSASGFGPSNLLRSTDQGLTWAALPGISSVSAMAVGATKAGASYPTILAQGVVGGTGGLYYTINAGTTWVPASGTVYPQRDFGNLAWMSGDANIPGRFYTAVYSAGSNWIQLW